MQRILYLKLTEDVLTDGSLFDALTHGTFVDMYGSKHTFREKDLETYVKNTALAIENTKQDDGEVVGLPIDIVDHNHGDGAGWITGIELDKERGVIQIKPSWTTIGVEAISNKIRRFFSATIDTVNKVFLGGTLTNWPAIRDKKGNVLLKPVELSRRPGESDKLQPSTGLLEYDDTSFDEQSRRCRSAFYDEYGSGDFEDDPWVREVFDDYAVVWDEGKDWRVNFKINKDDEYEFQEKDDWTEVRQTWIEAAGRVADQIKNVVNNVINPARPETNSTEDFAMEMTKEEFDKAIAEQVGLALKEGMVELRNTMIEAVKPAPPVKDEGDEEPDNSPDIFDRYDLAELKEAARAEMSKELIDQFEAMRADVRNESVLQIGKIRRETYLSEFAGRVTTGNDETPFGLPVESIALKDWLISLTPDQSEFAMTFLEGLWKSGRTEFTELGHTKDIDGTKELPDDIKASLKDKSMTLADLEDPIMQPVIGNINQYNLSEFKGE